MENSLDNDVGEKRKREISNNSGEKSDCHKALETLLSGLNSKTDDEVIEDGNRLISQYGIEELRTWRSTDKHQHSVLHVLVNFSKLEAIKALTKRLDQLNAQRASDQCTPLHLSAWKKNIE